MIIKKSLSRSGEEGEVEVTFSLGYLSHFPHDRDDLLLEFTICLHCEVFSDR